MPYFPTSHTSHAYDWHGMPAWQARAATTRSLGDTFGGPQSGPPGPLDVGAVVDSIPGGKLTVLAIAGLAAWFFLGKQKRRRNPARRRRSTLTGAAWVTLKSGKKVRRGSKAHRASLASRRAWARRRGKAARQVARGRRSVTPPRASPTLRPWETMWRYEGVRPESARPRAFVNPRRRRRRRR